MRATTIVLALSLAAVGLAALPAGAIHTETVLSVDDGEFFYDSDGDCVGDTNDHTQGEALRHWHFGFPFVPAATEFTGGFGCGPQADWQPQTWTVTVPAGHEAAVSGEVLYTWDQDVPGGGFNDVQLHVWDDAGNLAYSTALTNGPNPVVPTGLSSAPVNSHTIEAVLGPGTYTIEEDIWSGDHTTWLTELSVTVKPGSPSIY